MQAPERSRAARTRLLGTTLALAALAIGLSSAGSDDGDAPADAAPVEVRLDVTAITLVTGNFPEMLAFYRDAMGFEIENLDEENSFAEFAGEGVRVHLTTSQTMKQASGSSSYDEERRGRSFELAFRVAEPAQVDVMYDRIIAGGGTPVASPEDKPWRQRMAFFADPDGNIHDVFARL